MTRTYAQALGLAVLCAGVLFAAALALFAVAPA